MTTVISINDSNFKEEVLNHTGKVLVDFYTDKCPPCQMMAPVLDQLAEELSSTVKIVKVNAAQNQILVEKYQVNSVPTFVLIEDGITKKTKTGATPPAQLKHWMEVAH